MLFKHLLLLCSFVLLMNCKSNDNSNFLCSCAAQELSIELVNTEGVNLIENGTYNFDAIKVTSQFNKLELYSGRTQTEIVFAVTRAEGDNLYTIYLNESEADTLILNITLDNSKENCCPDDTINSAFYNGQAQEIITLENGLQPEMIIIVKS